MASYTRRSFHGETDIEAVVELRLAIESHESSGFPASRDRLRNAYLQPRPGWSRDFSLWERDGRLVGLGEIRISHEQSETQIAYCRVRVHPDVETSELADDVLSWGERMATEHFGSGFQVEVSATQGSDRRISLLKRRGYTVDRMFHMMKRSTARGSETQLGVDGYRLRLFRGESEIDAWLELYVNAFQDHYDFHPIAREDRVQSIAAEGYLPEFDLVIETGNGALAAFSIIDKRVDSSGVIDWHIDLIGTHRDHRKRGLAEWLLRYMIGLVHDHGGTEISLEVDATSLTGANRLYERLGFMVTSESIDYRKTFA